jgi:ribonuclease PH
LEDRAVFAMNPHAFLATHSHSPDEAHPTQVEPESAGVTNAAINMLQIATAAETVLKDPA